MPPLRDVRDVQLMACEWCVWGDVFFSWLSNAHFTIIYTTYKYYTCTLYTCESAFFFSNINYAPHHWPSHNIIFENLWLLNQRERDVSLVVCSLVKLWIPTICRSYKFTDYKLVVEFGGSVGRFFPGNKTQLCARLLFFFLLLFSYRYLLFTVY